MHWEAFSENIKTVNDLWKTITALSARKKCYHPWMTSLDNPFDLGMFLKSLTVNPNKKVLLIRSDRKRDVRGMGIVTFFKDVVDLDFWYSDTVSQNDMQKLLKLFELEFIKNKRDVLFQIRCRGEDKNNLSFLKLCGFYPMNPVSRQTPVPLHRDRLNYLYLIRE